MADVRYQAFVSSTFEDLKEERKEVIQALLESDCFPAGMELFAASNKKQWDIIKKVIDESDFYIVIIAGRYGSLGKDEHGKRISYTEMEFDYALSANKPIIALIYEDINKLPRSKCEATANKNKLLRSFRAKAMNGRLIKYWSNKDNLKSAAGTAINRLINDKDNNMTGWVSVKTLKKRQLDIFISSDNDEIIKSGDEKAKIPINYAYGCRQTLSIFQKGVSIKSYIDKLDELQVLQNTDALPFGVEECSDDIVSLDLISNYITLVYGPSFCGKSYFLRLVYSIAKKRQDHCFIVAYDHQKSWFESAENTEFVDFSDTTLISVMLDKIVELLIDRAKTKKELLSKRMNRTSLFSEANSQKRINLFVTDFNKFFKLLNEDETLFKYHSLVEFIFEKCVFYNAFFWFEIHDHDHREIGFFIRKHNNYYYPCRVLIGGSPSDYDFETDNLPLNERAIKVPEGQALVFTNNKHSKIIIPYLTD